MSTTSILDLPTEPLGGGGGSTAPNITLDASELSTNLDKNVSLDQTTINQIVSGLQQASFSGSTKLVSRDVPINTVAHNIDPYIQPNYVPPPPPHAHQQKYIEDEETAADMINQYNRNARTQKTADDIYNEAQTPLLLAILYFLFQLPFLKKQLVSYFPILFNNDGNYNINGYLFTSILFGIVYFIVNKFATQFNVF
jgi:hypothetical protein